MLKTSCLLLFLVPCCLAGAPPGSEYRGVVTFGGLPLPGATITATQGSKQFVTSSDLQGIFSFSELEPGRCTMEIRMTGFATVKQDVTVGPNSPPGKWELKLLPLERIKAEINPASVGARQGVPLLPHPPA